MSCSISRLSLVASLVGILAFAGLATARPGANIQQQQMKAAQKAQSHASDQTLVQAMHILKSVDHTLKGADHDYGGHRVGAVHAIGAAEKQLRLIHEHHHKHHKTQAMKPKTGKTGGGNGHPEPQALSNAQLAAAVPALHQAAHFISQANHDFGGHRAKAIKDIHHAVAQLQLALKYAAIHDKNKK